MDKRGALVRLLVAAPIIAGTFGAGHHILMHAVGGDAALAPLWEKAGFDADSSGWPAAAALGARNAWWLGLLLTAPALGMAYSLLRRGITVFTVGAGILVLAVLMATTGTVLGLALAMSLPDLGGGAYATPEGRAIMMHNGALWGAMGALPLGMLFAYRARKLDQGK